ncbi:hypothetical protein COCOBI_15-0520 [Coccomyxa sp. Obi]|nr:hypothetical protein COCOBI_15-0520 [Coccomyxa sp. Obi]
MHPSGLGPHNASQANCKPTNGSTINQAGSEYSEDECLEKLLQEVDQLRRAGNMRCAAKAFAEGVKLFTAALELKPDAAQLLINRAFARIMIADSASADEDCCLALALERRLPSAFRWRAAARRDCGWLVGAVEDMRVAARMAPTADKREAAMQEVDKLQEWIDVLEESEAMKKAGEECRAREAKAPALAAEAKAAFARTLNKHRADLARKKTEEHEWRKEQEALRKQAEEEIRKRVHDQQAAKMLGKMQRNNNVEVLSVDPRSGTIINQTADIDSFLTLLRPPEARHASGSSSKVPCSSEPFAASHSCAAHTPSTPSHAVSCADSSARQTMSAPAALHSGLFPEPKQAQTGSAVQSASQSTAVAVEEDSNQGDSDAESASMDETSSIAGIKSAVYNLCGETVTLIEPAQPFYFAGRQPRAAGKSSAAPKTAALPDQASVDAVLQEIAQKEHGAWVELGVRSASNAPVEADSCTESDDRADRARSSTASAEAAEQPPTDSTGTQEDAPTVRTKEADTPAAMETEVCRVLKHPREQEQASDQLPAAQEQQIDARAGANNTSARDPAADAPSGPAHVVSPEASSAADDTEDGCVSEAVESPAAETDCAAAPLEQTPAEAAPQSAATAAPECKEEPQPEHEAATDAQCWISDPEQAESVPATASAAEVSAAPEETASEATAWLGNRSKSQKKKAKRKAKFKSAKVAGAAESPLDKIPIPVSEADVDVPTGAATKTSTGTGDAGTCMPSEAATASHSDEAPIPVSTADTGAPSGAATKASTGGGDEGTCTPSEAATNSHSDDGAPAADGKDLVTDSPAADGEDSVTELQSAAGQERPMLDSSKGPDGDADAAAAPATNTAIECAASSSESPANTTNAADIRMATCEVEATLHGAASDLKAHKAEQTSASTTGKMRGRGLFSQFGDWFGMGGKQGAASEASGPVTEVDIESETTSSSATPDVGATSSPVSPSHNEGDYPGRDIYMKARAAHRRATELRAASKTQETSHHYREAVTLCDQALEVNPTIGSAYLTKAACYMHLNELQGAAEAYASALQHDLEHVNDASAHAHVDHIMGAVDTKTAGDMPKKDVVMALLDAAVRLSRSPEWRCLTLTAQGEAFFHSGNKEGALGIICSIFSDERVRAAFMSSSKITPAQRDWVSDLFKAGGNRLQEDKDWEGAKCLYSMSIGANPTNAASWNNCAYMNLQLALYEEAIEDATAVLDHTNNVKLRDKARRRRSLAYQQLQEPRKAYMDLRDIKRKSQDDIHRICCLELELMPFAEMGGDTLLVCSKEHAWVNELPAQKPALDKNGGVMTGRYDPLMDDDAEAGCTKEQLLQRIGLSQETAETTPAAAKTDAPETSGAASPTCVASGPYSSSSEGSSPANGQTSLTSNGVPTAGQSPPSGGGATGGGVLSVDEGPTAGQGPPSSGSAAGGDDGCGSRRPSSSYYTAEPLSPLSDASFGSALSLQEDQTAFLPQDGGRRTSSGSGAAVPNPETSPIDTPSDVSFAGDSSDSDSQRPRPRAVPVSFRQPSGRAGFDDIISNGMSSFHSNGGGDGSQSETDSAPASKAEPQERGALSNLRNGGGDGLFRSVLPGRVKVAPSSETFPTGPPKPAPDSPRSASGGSHTSSQWGPPNSGATWRQSSPAVRSGFLNRRMAEKQAAPPKPAESSDAAPVPEALPPPPLMRGGFFSRRPSGDTSEAKPSSEPQAQPDQRRPPCNDHQPELRSDDKRLFKGTPEEYTLLQKSACHIVAGEKAMMRENVMDAFEAADEAMRLINQAVKQGRTPCDYTALWIDKAFIFKATVLTMTGRHKDAMDCLTAALKLSKDSHACREARASMNIQWTRMFPLAVADLVKLCKLTPSYEPKFPLTKRIITLARTEVAADEQMSARKARRAAARATRKSFDGADKPGFRPSGSTPTPPGSEPVSAERASGDRRKTYSEIITQIINQIARSDAHQMQHASSRFDGAPSRHMHARGPHLPAHAPHSFYGGNSWGPGRAGL